MATATETLELENLGSLITIKGTDRCLGYLMDFGPRVGHEKGIWCPCHGEVSRFGVTPDHAKAHNAALDEAMLKGLDENCQIGQGDAFYLKRGEHLTYSITTFCGTIVANKDTGGVHVQTTKKYNCRLRTYSLIVWFWRGGKQYKGSNNGFDDLVPFKRVK